MRILRTSRLTGNTSAMNIDITQAQLDAWVDGSLIRDVMPNISADEREFIITGITPDEWDAMFGDKPVTTMLARG